MSTTITLQFEKNEPLNAVADYILLNKQDLLSHLDNLDMIKNQPKLFGSGEDHIVTITMKFTNPTKKDLKDIKEVIAKAKECGALKNTADIDSMIDIITI